ncbi:MAG: hypothetical protein KME30_01940 [Iphinoe sp. HA4291-MV1]|nr:hypothetical protein [Iphinoe sp. HA4291-MV1]
MTGEVNCYAYKLHYGKSGSEGLTSKKNQVKSEPVQSSPFAQRLRQEKGRRQGRWGFTPGATTERQFLQRGSPR